MLLWANLFGFMSYTQAVDTSFPYDYELPWGEEGADLWKLIKTKAVDPSDSASEQIQVAYKIDYAWEQRATEYLKELINWVLWIVGILALAVLIYGFYQMFLAKDDQEAMDKAKKIVTWAIIALFVIGTAWIVVSQFFDIFFRVKADTNEW